MLVLVVESMVVALTPVRLTKIGVQIEIMVEKIIRLVTVPLASLVRLGNLEYPPQRCDKKYGWV